MGKDTPIEWAHHTFNPWSGCTKVSAGCAHCYAAALPPGMRRHAEWGEGKARTMASDSYWREPIAWNRAAEKAGERHRVFCASTADVFEAREDLDAARARLFYLVQTTPHLDWLLLTKRPEYAVEWWSRWAHVARGVGHTNQWPTNAWIGTSVEDQAAADARIPHLLKIPAGVRFLSMEPLLGAVDVSRWLSPRQCECEDRSPWAACRSLSSVPCGVTVSWVIVGGESGRRARPMHPAWARMIRDQCVAAGVPFFFKQWGEWGDDHALSGVDDVDADDKGAIHRWPDGSVSVRVGKKGAGRVLDGRTWEELPHGL